MRAEPTLSKDNNSGSLAGEGHGILFIVKRNR